MWGTLIALLDDGVPVLGVLDQPVMRERWLGVAGQPTTLNGTVLVNLYVYDRPCTPLDEA